MKTYQSLQWQAKIEDALTHMCITALDTKWLRDLKDSREEGEHL